MFGKAKNTPRPPDIDKRIDERIKRLADQLRREQNVVSSTAEQAQGVLSMPSHKWSDVYMPMSGGVIGFSEGSSSNITKLAVTDFQHILDAMESLDLIEKVFPVDGCPNHHVIKLANNGGWLYYDPDAGLRTMTKRQADIALATEEERHLEEGVWS